MTGRGGLGRWGPNEAVDYIVTRYKRFANGGVIYREGQPLVEFMCFKRADNSWGLPGAFRLNGEDSRTALINLIENEVLVNDKRNPEQKALVLAELKETAIQVSEASYSLDPRNTDNAWVETAVFACHDELGE